MVKRKQSVQEGEAKRGRDRRTAPRQPPSVIPSLQSVELTNGNAVNLVNISRGGALVETEARMIPGVSICIRLVAADAVFMLRGRVLRSRALSLRGSTILYESAIAFNEELPLLAGEFDEPAVEKEPAAAFPAVEEAAASQPDSQPGTAVEERPIMFTLTVPIPPTGPDLRQIFGLNKW
ncbi:MAG: PilZ domain-containing protein [Acidobacteriia bacterium]|nr:PilZ domain-containing protein [Terriglobia bacterium]